MTNNTVAVLPISRMAYMCLFILAGILCFPSILIRDVRAETVPEDSRKKAVKEGNYRNVRVGLYENRPKIFTNTSGEASGIFPAILNEIARREKWNITYVPGKWDDCLAALKKGDIDLMPDVAFSLKRDEEYDFHTEAVVSSWSVVYARNKHRIKSITDLNGLRIAVLKDSIQQTVLQQMVNGLGLMVFFIEAKSFEEAFSMTARNEADAVITNNFFGDRFHRQYGLEQTPVILDPVLLYFATASGSNTDLLQAIDDNLSEMKSQPGSVYYKALQAGIQQPSIPVFPRHVIWLLCGMSGILLLAVLFIVLLRRQIRTATRDLLHTNEKLSESEKKFRDLFQKHSAVKLIINPENGSIIEANEAAEKFYGWSRDDLLWMRIQDINTLPPAQVEEEMNKARNLERTQFEFRHRLADGSIRDVIVFCTRIDIQGKPYLHSIIQDITERRREEAARQSAEQALRDNEIKYRMLFESAGDAIMLVRKERFTDCNAMALRVFGCDRDQLIGSTPYDFSPSKQPDGQSSQKKALEKIQWTLMEGPQRFEWIHCRKDGSCFPAEVSLNRFELNGETVLQAIVRDISERKQAEEDREKLFAQLVQSQKLESLGRLAGGVAHDYNNMLSVILGYTELALEQAAPSTPLHGHLTEVANAAKRSADITRQLLAFARRQPVEPRTLDLNESVTTMLKMLQRLIGENIDLIWQPGDRKYPIYMDPTQLDQILANLCTNASAAIVGAGKIVIEADTITFDTTFCEEHDGFLPGDFIVLAVSDDGCGMDRDILNNIFEPFFTTKGLGKGTGLGLATVYGIVKQNNGFINVYSEPGKGTTFRIYLPRHEGTIEEIDTDREEMIPKGNGETVLLVEDDPAILKLGRMMLETLGYKALTARTPRQAQRLAESHAGEIELLITDVIMPEMNGQELSDLLRASYPNMKTLFMSGYTADAITHQGVLNEGRNFMQKPFTLKSLSMKTRKVLKKAQVFDDRK